MKKIRLNIKNEDVQARLVIVSFLVIFSVLAVFFMNK